MTDVRELRADETAFVEEMLWTALAFRPGVELEPGDADDRMVRKLA